MKLWHNLRIFFTTFLWCVSSHEHTSTLATKKNSFVIHFVKFCSYIQTIIMMIIIVTLHNNFRRTFQQKKIGEFRWTVLLFRTKKIINVSKWQTIYKMFMILLFFIYWHIPFFYRSCFLYEIMAWHLEILLLGKWPRLVFYLSLEKEEICVINIFFLTYWPKNDSFWLIMRLEKIKVEKSNRKIISDRRALYYDDNYNYFPLNI